jgi:hypothetical protein
MNKILQWSMIGVLSLGGLAACGSDKKNDTVTTTAASIANTASNGATPAGTLSEFCAKTEALGDDYAAAQTGTVADDVKAALIARATALGEDLKAAIIASPADKDALIACLAAVKTAGG